MTDDREPTGGAPTTFERRVVASAFRRAALVAGAIAVLVVVIERRVTFFEYQPGGTAFFTFVRPVFLGLLVLGAVLALVREVVGAVIGGFAAGAIGAFAVNQLVGWHAFWVIVLLAVPALLWLLADVVDGSRRRVLIGVTVAVAAIVAGSIVGERLYERYFGPTHPESVVEPLPPSELRWIWSGGVTSESAAFRARTERDDVRTLRLAVTSEDSGFEQARYVDVDVRDGRLAEFRVDGLQPDVTYRYAVEVDGELDLVRTGEFRTFPVEAASFRFTVGGCARVGSNGAVFDAIAAERPLVHLISGDFHYGDIPDDDRERYDEVIDLTLRQPAQAALYRSTPIGYVWDDHDYGVNDADASSASRVAAMTAYRANVPSYVLAGDLSAVYQSFDVGRVRFVLTDARSEREPGVTMLGDDQLEWLLDELVSGSREQALVVWLNPVPWIAPAEEGADHWGGFAAERAIIADTIAEAGVDNLLMVSGDAHMVAIDDGTNSDYSASGDAGFPLIHAAALDRPGSTKGGPYSEGAIGGGGQYAVVDVDDDGTTIRVSLRAKRYDGVVLLAHDFEVPPPS